MEPNKSFDLYESSLNETVPENQPSVLLPPITSFGLLNDPRQFTFRLSRHKFVCKMLSGAKRVLEIGCQDGFTSLFASRYLEEIVSVDFFPKHVEDAKKFMSTYVKNVDFRLIDIVKSPVLNDDNVLFDAGFSLDVLEHIDLSDEPYFFRNILLSLSKKSIFIVGMPSLESQVYASKNSKMGHVNCKSGEDFKKTCEKYFNYVLMFSMNDEVVHTGFFPMAHYLLAVCCDPK